MLLSVEGDAQLGVPDVRQALDGHASDDTYRKLNNKYKQRHGKDKLLPGHDGGHWIGAFAEDSHAHAGQHTRRDAPVVLLDNTHNLVHLLFDL